MNGHIMETDERLDLLEKKVDLIMNKLGVALEQTTTPGFISTTDSSNTRLEIQKIKNEVKFLKIKFRNTPSRSPARDEIIKTIENLNEKQSNLEAELDESK